MFSRGAGVYRSTALEAQYQAHSEKDSCAWYQEATGDDTYFINGEFNTPTGGGEFMIRAGVRGLAWAGGAFGVAQSANTGAVQEICVEVE